MATPIITVEGLSKRYLLGHRTGQNGEYVAFRDVIAQGVRNFGRKALDVARGRQVVQGDEVEDFWALRDINFEINAGEIVGIIGRNGAGKSTLLKILSRITEPTTGRITLRGRVASLLEVGTGFHPELTGRENVFLNGAILGMTRREIQRKFDEIVAFSEVERFLDTPVKRYSSGMYVRLAFAVAAHLEPEILIVDEVLAVGDAEFQKKCLGKIDDVSRREGRTVLFVSHNIAAVRALCSRALYLRDSRIAGDSDAETITQAYLTSNTVGDSGDGARELSETLTLEAFSLTNLSITSGSNLGFEIRLSSTMTVATRIRDFAVLIYSSGSRVAIVDMRPSEGYYAVSSDRPLRIRGEIRKFPFVEGDYTFGLWLNCGEFRSDVYDLTKLHVIPTERVPGLAPYPVRHRGLVELDYIFGEASDDAGSGASPDEHAFELIRT